MPLPLFVSLEANLPIDRVIQSPTVTDPSTQPACRRPVVLAPALPSSHGAFSSRPASSTGRAGRSSTCRLGVDQGTHTAAACGEPRFKRDAEREAGAAVQKHASEGKWRAEQEYLEHPFLEGRPFLENSEMLQFATNLREGRGQKPERLGI